MGRKKGLKRILFPIQLFHISLDNHDGEVFKPRVPFVFGDEEDSTIKRVCFSSSISGAYRAITFTETCGEDCYIHVPEKLENIIRNGHLYKPSTELVFDADITDEYWIKCSVKMKCIGLARFYYNIRPNCLKKPKVNFKWIEKY